MKKMIIATFSFMLIAGIASAQEKTPIKTKHATMAHKTAKAEKVKTTAEAKPAATTETHAAIARKHSHKATKAQKQSSK